MPIAAPFSVAGDTKADLPVDEEGRLYHLGLRRGDISNLIITVGDERRAYSIALMFDKAKPIGNFDNDKFAEIDFVFGYRSSRGFLTYTGFYKGRPISVMAIGMGYSNMDFLVREIRTIVNGPLVIIRMGTCGSIAKGKIGQLAIPSSGSVMVLRNYGFPFGADNIPDKAPYLVSFPFAPDYNLTALLLDEATRLVGEDNILTGLNATTDSFYCSQGRPSDDFHDSNEKLIGQLLNQGASTLEMETGHLFSLASCSKDKQHQGIWASAIHVIVADRPNNEFLTNHEQRSALDLCSAHIVLNTLVALDFDTSLFTNVKVLSIRDKSC